MTCIKCGREIPDGVPYCCWCGKRQKVTNNGKSRGNGQGEAYQRGKTWTARWTEAIYLDADNKMHQRRRTKGGFTSKRAALLYAANPPQNNHQAPTLRAYYNTYVAGDFIKLSANTQGAMRKAFDRLQPIMDIKIDELTIQQIQSVVDSAADTYYTRKDMKTLLSHCYNLAIAEQRTSVNLAKYIVLPELAEEEPVPFSEIEIAKFWNAYPSDHFVGYILTMIYTGMMPGELFKLEKSMIDFDRNEIVRGGIKTKKRKVTPMVFPDFLAPVLHQLCEESQSKIDRVCCASRDNFYKKYYECLERVGVRRLPPYACRHTTATALAMKNIAPSVIQEIMRHTKFTTTQRYIHPDMENMVSAVNKMPTHSHG